MKRQLLLLILLMFVVGCNILQHPVYVLFGQSHKKVKAEYTGLDSKTIAVVVACGPGIAFEYPYAGLDVARLSVLTLTESLKRVEFVEPGKIDKFQREDLDWLSMPISQIAERFEVDRVLYIDLLQFTTSEINSVNLLRGYVTADVRVYESDSERVDQASYQTEISVVWPEHGPLALSDAAQESVYRQTITLFGDKLARRFYDHKVPVE